MPKSLYTTWQKRVAETPDGIALTDANTGEKFTFVELDQSVGETDGFPCGMASNFITQTLAAWRSDHWCLPIENNAQAPSNLEPPAGIAHIKTTSGSTGTPRHVFFTAKQLAADAENASRFRSNNSRTCKRALSESWAAQF